MVVAQVVGNDAAIAFAGASGNFELNVMLPVMARNLLESIRLLANISRLLADRTVDGTVADEERCRELAESSPVDRHAAQQVHRLRERRQGRQAVAEGEEDDPPGRARGRLRRARRPHRGAARRGARRAVDDARAAVAVRAGPGRGRGRAWCSREPSSSSSPVAPAAASSRSPRPGPSRPCPYAGHYRLVDVVLTNCLHSGLPDVWITQQTNPVSLSDHLNGGRPWDLDRTRGGFLALAPRQDKDTGKGGFSSGTADVLWRHTELIRDFGPEALVVVSADAVYALDYEEVVRGHLASDADVTMVTTQVDPDDASRYGVVLVEDGRVTDYAYKPDEPKSDLVTNEVFVFTPRPVLDLLDELGDAAGEDGPGDLGDALLPRLVEAGRAREHRFEELLARPRAPSRRTGRPTWTCCRTSRRSTRATTAGASPPAAATARPPASAPARPSRTRCCRRAPRSPARSAAACCRRTSSSRRAPRCTTASCCTARSCAAAPSCAGRSSTRASRSAPASRSAATATSRSSAATSASTADLPAGGRQPEPEE